MVVVGMKGSGQKYLGVYKVKQTGFGDGLDIRRESQGGHWCEPWIKGKASEVGTPSGDQT